LNVPIYEYRCAVCGHQLEALQKMSDEPLSDCPACHAPELKKQISAVGFRLSGTGWYETDFKTKDQRNISGDKQPTTNSTTEAPKASTSASQPSGAASQVSAGSDST
jgi:putative FmdB family regulatory protein